MTNPEIPAGMKPWHGGEGPPDDWDGGEVVFRQGYRGQQPVCWSHPWDKDDAKGTHDVIAYTPKAPAYPAGMTPEIAERMVALVRDLRADHLAHDMEDRQQDFVSRTAAIMAELEPVDPVETKARAIVQKHYPEAKDSYNGRRMTIAREAFKAGMELAEATP